MCGRYTIPFEGDDLEARFELSRNTGHFERTYNAAPGEMLPVITKHSPKKGQLMKWGFVPRWEKDPFKAKFRPINARNDKLTSGFFRASFKDSRCLVPASGYYEWRKFVMDGRTEKQPYYFTLKSQTIFGFGGLYSTFEDVEGKEFQTFCIITVEPNSLQKPIHNRMPLIIAKDNEDDWLDSESPMGLVRPYPSKDMQVWRVPTWVNSAREDGPKLVEKIPEN